MNNRAQFCLDGNRNLNKGLFHAWGFVTETGVFDYISKTVPGAMRVEEGLPGIADNTQPDTVVEPRHHRKRVLVQNCKIALLTLDACMPIM